MTGHLRELDLSWTVIRENSWDKLLDTIKDHSSLRMLNLSHNHLLEPQSHKPSEKDKSRGLTTAPLIKKNAKIVQLFVDMLEWNFNLINLNLEHCGLFESALIILISNLHLSDKIQCVHLSGNIEILPEFEQ